MIKTTSVGNYQPTIKPISRIIRKEALNSVYKTINQLYRLILFLNRQKIDTKTIIVKK